MKNLIIVCLLLSYPFKAFAQKDKVGINTASPSATLDVVSKENTNNTKAVKISNSSAAELLKVTNAGNTGINISTATPDGKLVVDAANALNIRHQNLPVLNSIDYTPPFNPLSVLSDGAMVGNTFSVKYLYYQSPANYPSTYDGSTSSGGFSLSDSNTYINIPVRNDGGLKGNSLGVTFGTDASATVNGNAVSNVSYMVIPTPGVYQVEFYGTVRCNRYMNTQNYSLSGQMQVNNIFATAVGNVYTVSNLSRGLLNAFRASNGTLSNTSYSYANPQVYTLVLQTTEINQKIGLFLQYVSGEPNQFTHGECLFNKPVGANMSYYLIVTKM